MTLLLFGTFSLSRSLGFTLHFSCSKLVCCKIKAVLSSCSIHVPYPHRAQQYMDLRFFPHASKCDNERGRAHALCPLTHQHLLQRLLFPQRSSQTVILVRSAITYRSLAATFTPGDHRSLGDSALVFGVVCTLADLTLFRRSSLLNNPLVYLVVQWVKIFVG